jgi:hypothetical protein
VSVTSNYGMHVVSCDESATCIESFRSASMKSVLRIQLENAGWKVTRMRDGSLRTICKYHIPPPVFLMPDRRRTDED